MSVIQSRSNRSSGGGESREPRVNLWRLPRLAALAARRVHLDEPRTYYVGTERRETREIVELLATTSEPLPVRAITPALVVGDTVVPDYEPEGANRYRFVAFEPDQLREGAAVRWGWPGNPERLTETSFRFSTGPAVAQAPRRGGTPPRA